MKLMPYAIEFYLRYSKIFSTHTYIKRALVKAIAYNILKKGTRKTGDGVSTMTDISTEWGKRAFHL